MAHELEPSFWRLTYTQPNSAVLGPQVAVLTVWARSREEAMQAARSTSLEAGWEWLEAAWEVEKLTPPHVVWGESK